MSSTDSPVPSGTAFGEPAADERKHPGLLTAKEREALIHEPGPSWREWLYAQAFPWWIGLACLIVDAWIAAGWIEVMGWLPLAASLAAAVYLEYLLYQYLWHKYDPERRGKFRRSWHTPFEVGRWSPDRAKVLRGDLPIEGPDPREFL